MRNDEHIGKKVSILSHILRRNIDERVEKYGLTGPQSRILRYLYDHEMSHDIYQRDLENEFKIRRSSVTSLVQMLEKNGLIQRISVSSDARLKRIVLTEDGKNVQTQITQDINQFEKKLENLLGDESTTFQRLLEKLIRDLG